MSELKATPGPWVVHPLRAWVSPEADIDMPICELRMATDDVSNEEQAKVDGRLIASAPDLYAKLEDCVKRLRRCALSGGSGPEMVDGLCKQFEQALARARGDVR